MPARRRLRSHAVRIAAVDLPLTPVVGTPRDSSRSSVGARAERAAIARELCVGGRTLQFERSARGFVRSAPAENLLQPQRPVTAAARKA